MRGTVRNLLTETAQPVLLRVPDFQRVYLTLVGCGGTGSHIASGLVAISQALQERSISCHMLFVDPDRVEPKNVGRQLFSQADIGEYKAEALAGRLNAAFSERIMSAARGVNALDILPDKAQRDMLHIVIGAVDNPSARATIADVVKSAQSQLWWLDCGNENHSGQICLGNAAPASSLRGAIALGLIDRLPAPSVVYPDLVRVKKGRGEEGKKRGRGASCAELAASGEQALMVNRLVAAWALSMLHDFVVTRNLRYFAVAFDQTWGGVRIYTIDAPAIAEVCGLKAGDVALKASKK
jgi:PRTRC genetic system ThiF family protein